MNRKAQATLRLGHIYLIGFSGSGKSTVGPLLACRLKRPFIDTDAEIERRESQTISEIFAQRGESFFRDTEKNLIAEIARSEKLSVIALGGGAFQNQVNREAACQSGTVIYLRTSLQALYQRLKKQTNRPLLLVRPQYGETLRQAQLRRIRELLQAREADYRAADLIVPTAAKSPQEVADNIMVLLKRHYAYD